MLTEIREIRVQKSTCTRIAYWGYCTRIARITRINLFKGHIRAIRVIRVQNHPSL